MVYFVVLEPSSAFTVIMVGSPSFAAGVIVNSLEFNWRPLLKAVIAGISFIVATSLETGNMYVYSYLFAVNSLYFSPPRRS